DDQGNQDGDREDHGKLTEKPADNASHQQNGNEDGNQRDADGQDRKANFAGALEGRLHGRHTLLEIARDVLDDDNGIVNDKARGNREGHEREVVDAVVAQVHNAKSANQGDGNGDAGNQGGAYASQEDEHHANDQGNGDQQAAFDVTNGSANCERAVHHDFRVYGGRDGSLECGYGGTDAIHGVNDVRARLTEDKDEDAGLAVDEAGSAHVFRGVLDLRDIA